MHDWLNKVQMLSSRINSGSGSKEFKSFLFRYWILDTLENNKLFYLLFYYTALSWY